jgi:amino acid adenylation domain-containing protein
MVTFRFDGNQEGERIPMNTSFVQFEYKDLESSIPDLFRLQVDKHSNKIAVKTANNELTYQQLDRASNRLARLLIEMLGVQQEPIALLFESGELIIISILAVLKAGKFWMPLNPLHSISRNKHLFRSSASALILTDKEHRSSAHEIAADTMQYVDIEDACSTPDDALNLRVTGDHIANLLYTFGSTGEPKGVIHDHRFVLHTTMLYTNQFRICPDDRISLVQTFTQVGARVSMFKALLNGASLHVFRLREEGINRLAKWLIQEQITLASLLPSVFRHMTEELAARETFPAIRVLQLSGDSVTKRELQLYQSCFSTNSILFHHLGSTETSLYRHYICDKTSVIDGNVVPAGYPVEDKDVILLDDMGREVAPTCAGEICVRSRYLSQGYWLRPELTADRFMFNSAGSTVRTYRTGDLGRMAPDGCLEYLGRKDLRVKIRGYLIDVSDVESALRQINTILDAAVVGEEYRDGGKRLVAYVVTKHEHRYDVGEWRAFLEQQLPDYMVPTSFVFVKSLPLTPSGKVDRLRLSSAELCDIVGGEIVNLNSRLENLLQTMWSEILDVKSIPKNSNFFELGGDSLCAMRLVGRINSLLALDLPVRVVFDNPTVATLALLIEDMQSGGLPVDVANREQ